MSAIIDEALPPLPEIIPKPSGHVVVHEKLGNLYDRFRVQQLMLGYAEEMVAADRLTRGAPTPKNCPGCGRDDDGKLCDGCFFFGAAPVPAGMKLVPIEPTVEMLTAGADRGYGSPRGIYAAMLAASPSVDAPKEQSEDSKMLDWLEEAYTQGGRYAKPWREFMSNVSARGYRDAIREAMKKATP